MTTDKVVLGAPSGESLQTEFIGWCFAFLYEHLESTSGLPWVLQALKAGLLPAFVYLHAHHEIPLNAPYPYDFRTGSEVVKYILPKYLLHRALISAAADSVSKLKSNKKYAPTLKLMEASKSTPESAGEAWDIINELVLRRSKEISSGGFQEPAVCGNRKVS
jgi:hypothetical protein